MGYTFLSWIFIFYKNIEYEKKLLLKQIKINVFDAIEAEEIELSIDEISNDNDNSYYVSKCDNQIYKLEIPDFTSRLFLPILNLSIITDNETITLLGEWNPNMIS